MASHADDHYYVPHHSHWPIVGSIGLALLLGGFSMFLNEYSVGTPMMILGAVVMAVMMFGWFGTVINESEGGKYNDQVDMSFRWGMGWFIFSEVMFFAAFFGALFYARVYAIPWLDGGSNNDATAQYLWPDFEAAWPLLTLPLADKFQVAKDFIGPWGLPALNTIILLTSGLTVTLAHWALKRQDKTWLVYWLFATVALGFGFVILQGIEYVHLYNDLNLRLDSGI